jgi:hypothetical protein
MKRGNDYMNGVPYRFNAYRSLFLRVITNKWLMIIVFLVIMGLLMFGDKL